MAAIPPEEIVVVVAVSSLPPSIMALSVELGATDGWEVTKGDEVAKVGSSETEGVGGIMTPLDEGEGAALAKGASEPMGESVETGASVLSKYVGAVVTTGESVATGASVMTTGLSVGIDVGGTVGDSIGLALGFSVGTLLG